MFWAMSAYILFHAMDFGRSEHSEEKVYEVYILSGLSWSAVSLRTRPKVISGWSR